MTLTQPTRFRLFILTGMLLAVLVIADGSLSPMTAEPTLVCPAFPSAYTCDFTYSGEACQGLDVGRVCAVNADGTCKYCQVAPGTTPSGIMAVCACS